MTHKKRGDRPDTAIASPDHYPSNPLTNYKIMTHFAFMDSADAGSSVLPLRNDISDDQMARWGCIEADGFNLGLSRAKVPKPFYFYEWKGETHKVFTESSFSLDSHHFFKGYWAGRKARAQANTNDERGSGRVTRRR